VSGNQLFHRKQADWHLTEIFLGETINKSGVSHDRVNLAVGWKRQIGRLQSRDAPRKIVHESTSENSIETEMKTSRKRFIDGAQASPEDLTIRLLGFRILSCR